MRITVSARLVTAGALALVAASGCAEQSDQRPNAAAVTAFRYLRYPPPELVEAEETVLRRCMRAQGFAYPQKVVPRPPAAHGLLVTPAVLTVEQAAAAGYGEAITRGAGVDGPIDAVQEYLGSLSTGERDRFMRAMNDSHSTKVTITIAGGTQASAASRGCVAEARKAAYGSVANFLVLAFLPDAAQQHVTDAEQDPTVSQAAREYAACMRAKGHDTGSPAAAVERAQEFYSEGWAETTARQRELDLAVADATCQVESGFHEKYRDAVDKVALQWIEEHRTAVLDADKIQRDATARAVAVLRRGSEGPG